MEWYVNKKEKEQAIFITNNYYTLRLYKTNRGSLSIHMVRTHKLKNDSYFETAERISEIEKMIIDLYAFIKEFEDKINDMPEYYCCKTGYSDELKQLKRYCLYLKKKHFKKKDEEKNEMVYN